MLFVRRIEEIAPDIIHIHNLHGYFLDYRVLFRYLSRCGIPVVWTVHDCWLYTGHCYYYSYVGCDKWQRGCNHCPQKKEFPASWLFDRSARNYADKRAAFASMPHEGLVFVPVSHWLEGRCGGLSCAITISRSSTMELILMFFAFVIRVAWWPNMD